MTWSYGGDPSVDDLSEVRYLVQDTDPADQLMTDEEIQFEIDRWAPIYASNVYAASEVAERIAAKFAREVSLSADGVTHGVSELQQKYLTLAERLREMHRDTVGAGAGPYAGAVNAWELWYVDHSVAPLSFGKGMHDNMRASGQDLPSPKPEYPELY